MSQGPSATVDAATLTQAISQSAVSFLPPGSLSKVLAPEFEQTNLVSDGFVPAEHVDPNLINPWGIGHSATSPFWVSDNGMGVATLYNGAGEPQSAAGHTAIQIGLPAGQTTPTSPTGQVFNDTGGGFDISRGGVSGSSVFLFATEDGTISGWNPKVDPGDSIVKVDNFQNGTGAVYKGLAIGTTDHGSFLYAANFRNGTVDVFNDHFKQVNSFTDPNVPKGFAPFNVQNLNGHLFVSFALQNDVKHDDVAGPGNGFVDEFDLNGHMEARIASQGVLNSPWGLDIAPADFGKFANDLLVGNFGDGKINAFDPNTHAFEGTLMGENNKPIVIGDLWALTNGTGGAGTNPGAVYFTAGVQQEAHGLFGSLAPT
jgi:uncharacterized protein (TIGR03118 family)